MRWQRSARLVIAAVGVATILGVVLTVRKRPEPESLPAVTRTDPKAVAETAGSRMTQTTGMRIPGFLESERALTYEDGSQKFIKPKLTTERSGRTFEVSGLEATVAPNQSHMTMTGDVVLAASDGLRAETEEATYSSGEEIVRAPGRVEFTRGALSGAGVGMTYDQQREVLWLLDEATITFRAEPGKDPGAHIVAGAAGVARRDKYLRFERGVTITRAGREMAADSALVYLTDDEQGVRAIELRENSRIAETNPAPGGLRAMTAKDINLTYAADGESLERALLAGNAAIHLAGNGAAGRRVSGSLLDLAIDPSGALSSLKARERVQLTLPAEGAAPERTIRADRMDGRAEPGRGLTGARFTEDVEFREEREGGSRVATAAALEVSLGGEGGALEDARFTGDTRFEDGATRAAAANARYQVTDGRLHLDGAVGTRRPQVQDARLTVDAHRIELAFEGPRLQAAGDVQSVLKPVARTRDPGGTDDSLTTPGLLEDDQPAYVTGAALDYDGVRGHAVYTGGARLWQGDTAITGKTLTIDESTGDLRASGDVRSAFVVEQTDTKTGKPGNVNTVATSEELHYDDAKRVATYTTRARMNGPQGDLRAEKIEMHFLDSGRALERVEAYRNVTVKTDTRHAEGDRLSYFAADERYVISGTLVRVLEIAECRETTGKTLTFHRSTDTILVDGNREIRTLTKSGGTCVAPPK